MDTRVDSQPPMIVCFDAATCIGVCDGRPGAKPRFWSWDFSKFQGGRAGRLLRLSDYLDAYYRTNAIDLAFVEAPLPIAVMMEIGSADETVQLLRGIVAIIEVCSARAGVPIEWWRVQEARKAVTGFARFERGKAKSEVVKYLRMLGHEPQDDNQADSLIGWLFESAKLNPRLAALSTPLFGRQ